MRRIVCILLPVIIIGIATKGQTIKFEDLSGGKWKYRDLPDSVRWYDSTLHLCPNNPSFWFKDKIHVDVVWNGFYFKDQTYTISQTKNLIFVYIDSIYENVSGFTCIFKPIKNDYMKLQYGKNQHGELQWNENETIYNTSDVYLFPYRLK